MIIKIDGNKLSNVVRLPFGLNKRFKAKLIGEITHFGVKRIVVKPFGKNFQLGLLKELAIDCIVKP